MSRSPWPWTNPKEGNVKFRSSTGLNEFMVGLSSLALVKPLMDLVNIGIALLPLSLKTRTTEKGRECLVSEAKLSSCPNKGRKG